LFDLHNSPSFDERLAKRVEIKTAELKDLETRLRLGLQISWVVMEISPH
jgi:hypothetical protein